MEERNQRRKFLGQLTAVSALTAIGNTSLKAQTKEVLQDEMHKLLTPPYIQVLTPTSVDIVFITAKKAYSWVEYGTEDLDKKVEGKSDGFMEAYQRINNIRISGLQPGKTYKYRVVSKEIVTFKPYELVYGKEIMSSEYSFTTPVMDHDEVSCLIFNDIHDRPYSFKDLWTVKGDKPYDFVFLNGDMFDYQEDEQQIIDHLLLPITSLFASEKAFIMSRGNHETRGKFRREFKGYFSYPSDKYYYSFKQGPVYWIILDTGEDKPDDAPVYAGIVDFDHYRLEQARWLAEIVETTAYKQATYRVVMMHIPPFHSGDWHGTMHCRAVFDPIFTKHQVDIVISGHTHRYGIHPPSEEHAYPIIIGGGPKEGNRTITHFHADKKRLAIEMKRDDGQIVGTYEI
ncbi:metallophosphoesterase [Olivibacter ginsenosidimutans]|uniref:Metallophosphoesterase n=1 Tax=Olivibacter ginsenosidimutans TaxID=1176537 RepID=A0ABP9C278_9SPHI